MVAVTFDKFEDLEEGADESWETCWAAGSSPAENLRTRFLQAIDPSLRTRVSKALDSLHGDAPGLRVWLSRIRSGATVFPEPIPESLIQVYFEHPEALP